MFGSKVRLSVEKELWNKLKNSFPAGDESRILEEVLRHHGEHKRTSAENERIKAMLAESRIKAAKLSEEIEDVLKERRKLSSEVQKLKKKNEDLRSENGKLRTRIRNVQPEEAPVERIVIKEDIEAVNSLKAKVEDLKERNFRYQNAISALEGDNRALKDRASRLEGALADIRRQNAAVMIKMPLGPPIGDPELKVLDSSTYYTYRNDPAGFLRDDPGRLSFVRELQLRMLDEL
ncbi:MAG: hypothetical protein QCI82_10230 [Candidatus Thermoplasmatota archaeon]|nr:hypothetical protein [Candidatus Thermoplasmatota archaeon]